MCEWTKNACACDLHQWVKNETKYPAKWQKIERKELSWLSWLTKNALFVSYHLHQSIFCQIYLTFATLSVVIIGEKASYRSFEIGLSKPLKHTKQLYRLLRFLSDEGPMLEMLDYTIRIGSTPIFFYFDLFLYLRRTLRLFQLYRLLN